MVSDEPAPSGDNKPPVIVKLTEEQAAFFEAWASSAHMDSLLALNALNIAGQLRKPQALAHYETLQMMKAIRDAVRDGINDDL